ELLDVYKPETLQKIIKSEEGRVSFPSKIVQDHYQQGLKTIAFQTQDISKLKENLEAQNIEVVGPIEMDRERSEEHTSELQSRFDLVCRLLLAKKNKK